MAAVFAFDVYGTLIDTSGVVSELGKIIGSEADAFARLWRDKQLEYSFRRGLMRCYEDFSVCVSDSLEFSAQRFNKRLTDQDRQVLLEAYRRLPAFADAADGLARLAEQGYALYAFSNGSAQTVSRLLEGAKIEHHFRDIISVEARQSFKPDPVVYRYFLERVEVAADRAWLVSGNSFDVIGAIGVGMGGIWLQRSADAIFDPWGIEPSLTVATLVEISDRFANT
jgi:2-haloacid dehalogenase